MNSINFTIMNKLTCLVLPENMQNIYGNNWSNIKLEEQKIRPGNFRRS